MFLKDLYRCACLGIPELHPPVHTPTGKHATLRTERHARHKVGMPDDSPLRLPRFGIPQPHYLVRPPARKHFVIPIERDAMDGFRMTGERLYQLTRFGIPQSDRLIVAPTGEGLPIATERDTIDGICMTGEYLVYAPPVLTFHSRIVLSALPLARVFPFRLNVTLVTTSV